ncbi:TetR/AcrR family transcriptional regulator [Streptomyces griseorubiginosus]|uniref:TetR/AcrR family transcriptional regulator n=1 Tax=Streptomyces griseorubiginosus TaxID=67304 RepID=UPI001140824D|nr:TetR/AcrR family transcriptional regulator [Streptomyces griseorubiginosus]
MASRSDASRKAILKATLDLLGDEPPGPLSVQKLSIERIARQAGVSKMTIYRWWPSKAAVVIESFLDSHLAATPVRQEGRAIDALREHMRSLARVYAGPEGRIVAQLIAESQYDPETLKSFNELFWLGRQEVTSALVARAVAEGDLRSDFDPKFMAELLYGPIYLRLLTRPDALSEDLVEQVWEATVAGLAPLGPASNDD